MPTDFPGSPISSWIGDFLPPPDALAFYLPFHFFYPVWWGIYLTIEGVNSLGLYIFNRASGVLTFNEAILASQIFLYGHEAFHHNVESFATRLEISHRIPLYKSSFSKVYNDIITNPARCKEPYPPDEEALAGAYGYIKTKNVFKKDKQKQLAVTLALQMYFDDCPPCYSRALELLSINEFRDSRCDFAELNYRASFNSPSKDRSIWLVYPHAFSGIGRISSKINYVIHQNSPLARRGQLRIRYIRYRELAKKLQELAGCRIERKGKGSHVVWINPYGKKFIVPRHPGDLKMGTLKSICKQAGINMSVSEFLRA
jgi:predicted RNA binding protein YcfA (HicA-like mRNA interferase family)